MTESPDAVLARTRQWIERAVIGLGLCPFARVPYEASRLHCVVSNARAPDQLVRDLESQLLRVHTTDARELESVLLIHPWVLEDFLDYNDFLDVADALLEAHGLADELQVASFHPRYQFGDAEPDAIENYTNRSPYPMLHVLRNDSVERAVATLDDPTEIYRRNIDRLRALGEHGWRALFPDA